MKPPETLNVLDKHAGFTAATKIYRPDNLSGNLTGEELSLDTLWRPGWILRGGPDGTLVGWKGDSFYQLNNDVTIGLYKVKGYRYLIACWWDNLTGKRIA
jgi:hypothetical protein